MSRFKFGIAFMLTAILFVPAPSANAASGKVPGLHISTLRPSFAHARVPRVVRGFNPKQRIMSSKRRFELAPRR